MKARVKVVDMTTNKVVDYDIDDVINVFYMSCEKIVINSKSGTHTYINSDENYSISILIL